MGGVTWVALQVNAAWGSVTLGWSVSLCLSLTWGQTRASYE